MGEHLVLLVGSNPLPNYLAAATIQPTSVTLMYSKETEEPRKCLEAVLRDDLGVTKITPFLVRDATSAPAVAQAFEAVPAPFHLNYTGGTKVMAAKARSVFEGPEAAASYVDERSGKLRLDSGLERELRVNGLNLELLLRLHGLTRTKRSTPHPSGPTAKDVLNVLHRVLDTPELAAQLYQLFKDARSDGKWVDGSCPINERFELSLSESLVPGEKWPKRQVEAWAKFLTGDWLELYTASLLEKLTGLVPDQGVRCRRQSREFEVDVLAIKGHRLFFISCTTETDIKLAKLKLFEATVRARHIGGDLSRCALVWLGKADECDLLVRDVAEVWDSPNPVPVFGLPHLREWAGLEGPENLDTLRAWLER